MTTAAVTAGTLRPLRHLAWRTTVAGNVAIIVPGAIVTIVIAIQDGRPVIAVAAGAIALLLTALIILPALRIRTTLDPDGITTYWTTRIGALRIARERVRRSVIRTIYNPDGVSTNRHLFLLDDQEHTVLRMSDRWWTDEQLLTVAHHFGAPLESHNQPVHLAEVRRSAASQLRWAERHSITAIAALIAGGFLLCLGFAALANAAL